MRASLLPIFIFFSVVLVGEGSFENVSSQCHKVVADCIEMHSVAIPRCVETKMRNCRRRRTRINTPGLYLQTVSPSSEARVDTEYGHVIYIPSEAVLKSGGEHLKTSGRRVDLTVSVLNTSLFEAPSDEGSPHEQILGVWLGMRDVHNLSNPVRIVFVNVSQNGTGKCVFWKLSNNSNWSTDGCKTTQNNSDFICECNHLSFFAMLISPDVPDPAHVQRLVYISYIGSSLSVVFTIIIIVLFLCHRKSKAEHSVIIHVQLTGSLLLLHLFYLASSIWSEPEWAVCQALGLMLHWALLATFTWTAIEGFHLYLLLVRVFNIYIRRYLLKLSLVGWGLPTITVMICGVVGAYGKHTVTKNTSSVTVAMDLCWFKTENEDGIHKAMKFVTVTGYLGLVLLFNVVILAVMVVKTRQLRARSIQSRGRVRRMWKDLATILGLSCVLGLPWGLAFTIYGPLSLPGTYLFNILNAFQGVLMFLWFLSITCKSIHEEQKSTKDFTQSHLSS
ncbi:adhesion G protein-coupled receptor G3-like isoform X2 [Colossoma macropomum]|uniref:adhesion G protein-coupled receptor G3-like isoform X2 n=1 Tax=Colossoma macropomum TaxID=42526 RepID=UPI00186461E0|nr:adhesion G protein-coupled receptor G3-like isoform X2 [Colossoma macropomum]